MATGEIGRLFEETQCGALLSAKGGQRVVELPSSATVAEGCRALMRHGISSAPVYDAGQTDGGRAYVGMLDYRDIAAYVLAVFRRAPAGSEAPESLEEIVRQAAVGAAVHVGDIADLSRRNPFLAVRSEDALAEALRVLSSSVGAHRVCVVAGGAVVGVLSKTDIVRFCEASARANQGGALASLFSRPIDALGLGADARDVVTVRADECALDALERMAAAGVSSAAVLGDSCASSAAGRVLGNISLTDVRLALSDGHWDRLWLPCGSLVALALRERAMAHDGQDSFPVFEVRADAPLLRAVQKMLATHVHRVWAVGPPGSGGQDLCGVVSLTDVVRLLHAAAQSP